MEDKSSGPTREGVGHEWVKALREEGGECTVKLIVEKKRSRSLSSL